jgi:hypothetical protein
MTWRLPATHKSSADSDIAVVRGGHGSIGPTTISSPPHNGKDLDGQDYYGYIPSWSTTAADDNTKRSIRADARPHENAARSSDEPCPLSYPQQNGTSTRPPCTGRASGTLFSSTWTVAAGATYFQVSQPLNDMCLPSTNLGNGRYSFTFSLRSPRRWNRPA